MNRAEIPAARLAGFYFAYYAVTGAFTPYWSLYLQSKGLQAGAISVLMSLWYATRIFAPSAWTTLAAHSRQPIRWLWIGCALTLLGFAGFFLPLNFIGLFVAMCAFCFFCNAVMPQFESITQSHLEGRNHLYGRIRVWGSVGFMLVVASFGWLIGHVGVGRLPWLMLPLLLALFALSFVNNYAHLPEETQRNRDDGLRARLRQPSVIAFLVAAFMAQVSFGPFYTFYTIYLENHGYSSPVQGLLWSAGVLAEICVFFLSARIFRRWDAGKVLALSMLGAALRWWVVAAWPDNTVLMTLAQVSHALSFGAFFAAVMQLLARFFPGRMNGHGQGLFYGLSSGMGGVTGALLAGQLWRIGGTHAEGKLAFAICGFIALLGAGVAWKWLVNEKREW
jgi:PPP family 3-phenylpropionic acid transporter